MNAERQRQHEAHRERQARMKVGRAVCRAVIADVVREPIVAARRQAEEEAALARLAELERQHRIRIGCIAEAFDGERLMARATLSALLSDALIDITQREAAALTGEREFYLLEMEAAS